MTDDTYSDIPSENPANRPLGSQAAEAVLSERVAEDEALAMNDAASREIAQLRREVGQLTETVALLLDMQQGSPRPNAASGDAAPNGSSGFQATAGAALDAARTQGHDALQRGQEAVGALGSTLERQMTALSQEVSELAEKNPLGTVVGALGLGFVVGSILRRR